MPDKGTPIGSFEGLQQPEDRLRANRFYRGGANHQHLQLNLETPRPHFPAKVPSNHPTGLNTMLGAEAVLAAQHCQVAKGHALAHHHQPGAELDGVGVEKKMAGSGAIRQLGSEGQA
jgi:hypothetical protein